MGAFRGCCITLDSLPKVLLAHEPVDSSAVERDVAKQSSYDDLVEVPFHCALNNRHAVNSANCSTPFGLVCGSSTSESDSPR
jgi:hypothetical protein